MSDHERNAHQKWAMWAGCRLLRGNEQLWANRSGRSPKMSEWANHSFSLSESLICSFWAKNVSYILRSYWLTGLQIYLYLLVLGTILHSFRLAVTEFIKSCTPIGYLGQCLWNPAPLLVGYRLLLAKSASTLVGFLAQWLLNPAPSLVG